MPQALTLHFQRTNTPCHRRRVRQRLDQVLVERGLCESREKAKRAIMAGQVKDLSKKDIQNIAAYLHSLPGSLVLGKRQ